MEIVGRLTYVRPERAWNYVETERSINIMLNKSISLNLALALTFAWSGCSQTGGITKINGRSISTGEIDKVVTELMESANVTGLCLAVLNNNKVAYLRTYGYRNRETEELLDDSTIILGA